VKRLQRKAPAGVSKEAEKTEYCQTPKSTDKGGGIPPGRTETELRGGGGVSDRSTAARERGARGLFRNTDSESINEKDKPETKVERPAKNLYGRPHRAKQHQHGPRERGKEKLSNDGQLSGA